MRCSKREGAKNGKQGVGLVRCGAPTILVKVRQRGTQVLYSIPCKYWTMYKVESRGVPGAPTLLRVVCCSL